MNIPHQKFQITSTKLQIKPIEFLHSTFFIRHSTFHEPRNPLYFHNKWKYNRPASDGKEKILPQGGLDF